jgi:hypothetical protein
MVFWALVAGFINGLLIWVRTELRRRQQRALRYQVA